MDKLNKISLTAKEAAIESEIGNIAKGSFIASLDHKLRAPMNSIMGMLNLLAETELNEHQQGYVDSALQASKFLLKTINLITDFPVDSYELKIKDIPFDLFKAGKNVVKVFSGAAASKRIALHFECEADTPTLLNGDPLKLQQVLAKVMENALAFIDKGSIKLIASAIETKGSKALIEFRISDTGPGISEDKLSKIFDFTSDIFSSDPKMRRVSLELAVCKRIVEAMEGQIDISSTKGEGTEVVISIPFRETPAEVIDAISEDQKVIVHKNTDAFKSFNGLKVI